MVARSVMPAGLISAGFQKSATNSTAVSLTSTIRNLAPSALLVSVETRGVRLRMDSTAPTRTTGVLLTTTGSPYFFDGLGRSADLKFVSATSTAGTLSVQTFKRHGEAV